MKIEVTGNSKTDAVDFIKAVTAVFNSTETHFVYGTVVFEDGRD